MNPHFKQSCIRSRNVNPRVCRNDVKTIVRGGTIGPTCGGGKPQPLIGQRTAVADIIRIKCSKCSKILRAPEAARGQKVKCSGCGHSFRIAEKKDGRTKPQPASAPRSSSKARPAAKQKPTRAVEEFDDVEVVDAPPRKGRPARSAGANSGSRPKPPPRPKSQVIEDFDEIDEYDDFDDGLEDPYGEDDFDDYAPRPTRSKPKRRKGGKKKKRRAAADDDDDTIEGTVIGGIVMMLIGGGIFFLAINSDPDKRGYFKGIVFGVILFCSGLVALGKGLLGD